jgi:hypothetical protein
MNKVQDHPSLRAIDEGDIYFKNMKLFSNIISKILLISKTSRSPGAKFKSDDLWFSIHPKMMEISLIGAHV